jgi:hypothetical protein
MYIDFADVERNGVKWIGFNARTQRPGVGVVEANVVRKSVRAGKDELALVLLLVSAVTVVVCD